jgi:hypothetical protein
VSVLSHTHFLRLLAAIAIGVIATVLNPFAGNDASYTILQVLGGGIFAASGFGLSIFALVFCSIPPFVFCYLFADFFYIDFERTAAYIFSRTEKRGKWLAIKLVHLSVYVFAYSLLTAVISFCLISFSNGHNYSASFASESVNIFEFLVPMVTLNALSLLILLIPINILAVRYNLIFCFVTVMAIYLISLVYSASVSADISSLLIQLLPTTQGVFVWHDTEVTQTLFGQDVISGYSLLQSYLYLFVVIIAWSLLSLFVIKRMDLL